MSKSKSSKQKNKKSKQPKTIEKVNFPLFEQVRETICREKADITEIRNSQHTPLDLLVLLILNQSCSDDLADRAYADLREHYTDYQEILEENDSKALAQVIKICGLAPTKSQYILNLLEFCSYNYDLNPDMPYLRKMNNQEALAMLTSIKGIGVKSASCCLMFALGRHDLLPIDTHLYRILKRLGIIDQTISTVQAHKCLQPVCNKNNDAYIVHVALIELGREICQARSPKCNQCYLAEYCQYLAK